MKILKLLSRNIFIFLFSYFLIVSTSFSNETVDIWNLENNNKIDKSKLTDKPVCIIVGPEGDFSEAEREKILSFKGVQPIKINENILRSETAVISAISIINYVIN